MEKSMGMPSVWKCWRENFKLKNDSIEQQFEINDLYKCLQELDQVTSECIILFEISGFSIKEIMGIQHSSEAAVKQRLSRGRKQLLTLMQSLEIKNGVLWNLKKN